MIATITDNGSNSVQSFAEFEPKLENIDDFRQIGKRRRHILIFSDICTNRQKDDDGTQLMELPKHVRCVSHAPNLANFAITDFNNAINSKIYGTIK